MAETKKQEVATKGKEQASLVVNNAFVDGLVAQLQQKEKFGLTFPKGYNYANELMGACPTGKIGLLSSMFTNPDYRRKGIAKELLSRVVNDAREYGCGTVQITASDMGVKLYTDFGFVHNDNFMQYKI